MAGEDRFTLFGFESPEQIRSRIGRTQEEKAYAAAAMPRGRGGVALASLIGQKLGSLFSGPSKEEEMAASRTEAMMNAFDRSAGDSKKYYRYLAENLNTLGDAQGALQALEYDRSLQAAQANLALESRKIDVTEKKNSELYLAKQDALKFKEEKLELDAELGRAKAEVARLTAESNANLNTAKVKELQAKIEDMEVKQAQNAEKLRQKDDELDILRGRAATYQFDADTRRMKIKSDERIAALREKGKSTKASQALFKQAMGNYDKVLNSKEFMGFASELVKDDEQLGAILSAVDPDQLAMLVKGEVKQLLGDATINYNTEFDFNAAVIEGFYRAADKYTQTGEAGLGYERPEMTTPRPAPQGSDEDLMNFILNQARQQ